MHDQINIGIAVDVAAKDGTRSLKVPNIKNAGALDFAHYVEAFDDIVARARSNKLTLARISKAPPFRSPIRALWVRWARCRG